jgi:hypothetical protein
MPVVITNRDELKIVFLILNKEGLNIDTMTNLIASLFVFWSKD